MVAYADQINALEAKVSAINVHMNAIRGLLIDVDGLCAPLHEKNIGSLRALDGLLQTDAQRALLTQITGPSSQGGGSPPPPPPPHP
ncbi:MAG: hypothetical protein WCI21_03180 [Alphaproteobacteria bacterium]